jgi:hypothetical protein
MNNQLESTSAKALGVPARPRDRSYQDSLQNIKQTLTPQFMVC